MPLIALAEFAATHGEAFDRIESVARMQDGTLRVLDLTEPRAGSSLISAGPPATRFQVIKVWG